MKKAALIMFFLLLATSLALWAGFSGDAKAAQKGLMVEIGKSASDAKIAFSHNITEENLAKGQTEYQVYASKKDAYTIKLTEEELKNIRSGATVIVSTSSGDMRVKITPKEQVAKKSGW